MYMLGTMAVTSIQAQCVTVIPSAFFHSKNRPPPKRNRGCSLSLPPPSSRPCSPWWILTYIFLNLDCWLLLWRRRGRLGNRRLWHWTKSLGFRIPRSTWRPKNKPEDPGEAQKTIPLWSGTNKNRDVSTGLLARPFARTAHSYA